MRASCAVGTARFTQLHVLVSISVAAAAVDYK